MKGINPLGNNKGMGANRTGVAMSPIDAQKLFKAEGLGTFALGSLDSLIELRCSVASTADTLGTIAPPGTLKGAAATMLQKLKGENPELFIDKLGERLAFERTGVRLYEALISKCSAQVEFFSGEHIAILETIRQEEFGHFQLVQEVMRKIGADPTAMTPSADMVGMMASGLLQIVTEARISAQDSLQALLLAELADNEAWGLLVQLAEQQGMDEVAQEFRQAELAEQSHLVHIRSFVAQATQATLPEAKGLH